VRRPARPATPQPAPRGALRLAALRLLGRRDYTSAEIARRLLDRGFLPEDVATTVAALVADGSLDDARTARSHVRVALHAKGRGRLRILAELRARGIDDAVAREALSDLSPDDDQRAIERFVARRCPAGVLPGDRDRVFRQLLRRGFPAEAISRVLKGSTSEGE
jgi:regulatory protein